MTIEAVMARLRSIADRSDEWERPRFDPPATAEQVAELDRRSGPIPDDLRAFLLAASQVVAMDIHNGYRIGGDLALAPHADVGFPGHVETQTGPTAVIRIATDGGGNAFLQSPERGTVWFWDHETGRTRPVADSFTGLLSRVADDWEHFAADDRDWKYLV